MDNRLHMAGNNMYTHDKKGFRSIWNHGGQYTLYEYGPDYRLLKAEKRETGEVFEFTHDDQGRRAVKYRNGQPVEAYRWLDFYAWTASMTASPATVSPTATVSAHPTPCGATMGPWPTSSTTRSAPCGWLPAAMAT